MALWLDVNIFVLSTHFFSFFVLKSLAKTEIAHVAHRVSRGVSTRSRWCYKKWCVCYEKPVKQHVGPWFMQNNYMYIRSSFSTFPAMFPHTCLYCPKGEFGIQTKM